MRVSLGSDLTLLSQDSQQGSVLGRISCFPKLVQSVGLSPQPTSAVPVIPPLPGGHRGQTGTNVRGGVGTVLPRPWLWWEVMLSAVTPGCRI